MKMIKQKTILVLLTCCFLLFGTAIILFKTNSAFKEGVKSVLNIQKVKNAKRVLIYDHSQKMTLNKPKVFKTAPSFRLTDQNDQLFESKTMDGDIWVVNFIFTSCQATCPKQTATMAQLQSKLSNFKLWND